jgi:hypothetical protein
MEIVIVLVVAAIAVAVVAGPLRAGRASDEVAAAPAALADLEAAKRAKLREIRDAELDHRLGKLSAEDWRALDDSLRAEAVELIRELDELQAGAGSGQTSGSAG